MSIVIFLLLISICLGLIYLVHKYLGKSEFYILAIIYSILSFIMSFKLVNIFGVDINLSIIFSSGLLVILYYFINRYGKGEDKKLITTIGISTILFGIILILNTIIVPSLSDKNSIIYQSLIFDNIPILILYPISLIGTLIFSSYIFNELKKEDSYRLVKTLLTVVGIVFADVFIFIYFSYAFIIKFDTSIMIALGNYLFKTIITIMYILIINKIFDVKKVK
ncbi:MAG: hypothetical protein ACI310_03350 [Bacilli bacterium]